MYFSKNKLRILIEMGPTGKGSAGGPTGKGSAGGPTRKGSAGGPTGKRSAGGPTGKGSAGGRVRERGIRRYVDNVSENVQYMLLFREMATHEHPETCLIIVRTVSSISNICYCRRKFGQT